jgi:uncharacterized surface protein with fasciclin (FAS1) repeats
MSFRNPTLVTAAALGGLLTLGAGTKASAGGTYGYAPHYGHAGYHDYGRAYAKSRRHGHHPALLTRYLPHPMTGHPGTPAYGHAYGKYHPMYAACGGDKHAAYLVKVGTHEGAAPQGDIVDVAVAAGSFNTLVAAIEAAGLVETLKGAGPFTVFAPTDAAFAKIPKADLDALIADKERLTAVLTYHVVPGKVMAADVVKLDSAETVQGGSVRIDTSDGVSVDGAKVVETDIETSNGVIHVIDTVLMPE